MCLRLTVFVFLHRFLIAINGTRPEVVQLKYKADGGIDDYVKRTFSDTATWLCNAGKSFDL